MSRPKKSIPLSRATRLINHGCTILVTSQAPNQSGQAQGKPNIITLAWQTPISHNPPLVGIAIRPKAYSHELISQSGEFVINVPGLELLDKVQYCGSVSGRSVDKFAESGLTPAPGQKVTPPLIAECIGHLECKVKNQMVLGDHTLFVGEVVAASVVEGLFEDTWLVDKAECKTIHHLGGTYYTTPEKIITV